jgi:hypothetical protein
MQQEKKKKKKKKKKEKKRKPFDVRIRRDLNVALTST